MAVAREIQLKIKSVKNIKKITEAMEAVSANKMRRNQVAALQARPYAQKAMELLANVSENQLETMHPLLATRDVKRVLLVPYSADKGLCGSFNSNVIKELRRHAENFKKEGIETEVYSIGKKVHQYCEAHKHAEIGSIEGIGDTGADKSAQLTEIANDIISRFESGEFDEVRIMYNNFVSTVNQNMVVRQLLPFSRESLQAILDDIAPSEGKFADQKTKKTEDSVTEYTFEPSEAAVLDALLPQLVRIQMLHALLESNASEHSARMMAMKNATDNAGEMINDLQLTFNKARQAGITQEIAEIVTGAEALK